MKYLRCKDIRIRQLEFVAKTQLLDIKSHKTQLVCLMIYMILLFSVK